MNNSSDMLRAQVQETAEVVDGLDRVLAHPMGGQLSHAQTAKALTQILQNQAHIMQALANIQDNQQRGF